jgi:hypothetical protein
MKRWLLDCTPGGSGANFAGGLQFAGKRKGRQSGVGAKD